MKNTSLVIIGLLLILTFSCKEEKQKPVNDDKAKDREVMLTFMADSLIIPSYNHYQQDFIQYKSKADAFTANPTLSTLQDFRNAWIQNYLEWEKIEMFEFGPAEKQTLRNFFNIYPADTTGILANINNSSSNLDVPSAYAQQGFPALDYLLFGVANTQDSVLAFYTEPVQGVKRLAYLNRLNSRMESLLSLVINDWKGDYRNTFISKTGLDISSSTSLLVNGIVLHYERFIRSGKVGIPCGALNNNVIAPEKVEALYKKDLSRQLIINNHEAFSRFFNGLTSPTGKPGYSLKSYLDAIGAKEGLSGKSLTEILNAQFATCMQKIMLLDNNFYNQVKTNNAPMLETYNELMAATRMLKVDMTSAMSITITYTDNDGD